MYVDSGRVVANSQRPGPVSRPASLPSTVQPSGALTLRVTGALRSGWSKQANIRGASSRNAWL